MTTFLVLDVILIGLLAGLLAVSLWGGTRLIQRRTPDPADSPAHHGLPYEEVSFPSRYRAQLQGWWIPASQARGTVILCHGQNGSMDSDVPHAVPLHQAGYNVLMFNFRAHGGSQGPHVTFGVYEKEDLLGALDFLVAHKGVAEVAVMGFSMGAGVALIGAALTPRIRVLILDGIYFKFIWVVQRAIAERVPKMLAMLLGQLFVFGATLRTNTRIYQVSPMLWAKHLAPDVAALFIHGERDPYATLGEVQQLAEEVAGPHQIWVAPGSQHRQAAKDHPQTYQAQVLAWLAAHL